MGEHLWPIEPRIRPVVITFGFGAAGPMFMNAMFDLLGSYRPAFALFIVMFVAAAILISFMKPPRPHRYSTPLTPDAAPPVASEA